MTFTAKGKLETSLAETYAQIAALAGAVEMLGSRSNRQEALGIMARLIDVAVSLENALEFIEAGRDAP